MVGVAAVVPRAMGVRDRQVVGRRDVVGYSGVGWSSSMREILRVGAPQLRRRAGDRGVHGEGRRRQLRPALDSSTHCRHERLGSGAPDPR